MTNKPSPERFEDAVERAAAQNAAGFGPVKIKQSRGPTIEFKGRLLASTEWETRDGQMRLELYQSRGGALIPVTRTDFEDGRRALVSAAVVEPVKPGAPIDNGDGTWRYGADLDAEQARRLAVLSFWDWTDRARSLAREQLGWSLKLTVD